MTTLETAPAATTEQKPAVRKTTVRKLLSRLSSVLSTVLLYITGLGVVAVTLMGGSFMTILTGSMTPSIPPGHIVVNVPVDTADLRVGDVIAYMPKDTSRTGNLPITHRVQALHKNGKGEVAAIITKGDANPAADNPITPSQVQSKTVFVIPYLGYPNVWSFFHGTPNLQVLALGTLVIYLSCSTVAGWVRKARSKRYAADESV